jgi:hypothetical protein
MRTIISLGFATMLILAAVGTWAAATNSSQVQPELSAARIAPLDLMMNARDLPAREYDAF